MHKHNGRGAPAFALALFAVILTCILGLVVLGTRLYGGLVDSRSQNEAGRATLRYLSTALRGGDCAGGVAVRPGPEGGMLVLADEENGYETRIYLLDGWLVEETGPLGGEYDVESAQPVAQETEFVPEFVREGLLRVTTSRGEVIAALRSGEGGAP